MSKISYGVNESGTMGQLTAATEGATRARIAEVLKLARAIDMIRLGRVGGIWFNVEKESE